MDASASPLQCSKLRLGDTYRGKQGLDYAHGISRETVGAHGLCMHVLTFPPKTRAKAHLHEAHETAIYTISGEVVMWWGERLEHRMDTGPGDMIYIPPGMPHLPVNLTDAPATVVLARTDPNEQESVLLLPELEELVGDLPNMTEILPDHS
ncbi:MAG: cupin domain-containing protein [Pseudomonadota bacterium]